MNKTLKSALKGLLAGAALTFFLFFLLSTDTLNNLLPNSSQEGIIFFIALPLCPFLAIFLHELGHLVVGLYLGYRLELFVVFLLGIKRQDDKLKYYLNTDPTLMGGITALVPSENKSLTAPDLANILLAGPLSSLLSAVVGILILTFTDSLFNSFFALFVLFSIGIFVATTLPNKSGIMFTDRKRYQRLKSKGVSGQAEVALIQIINQVGITETYKDLKPEWIEAISKDPDPTMQFWANYLYFQQAKENNMSEQQSAYLEKLKIFEKMLGKQIWKALKIDE